MGVGTGPTEKMHLSVFKCGGREAGKGDTSTSMGEGHIHWSPPTHALTGPGVKTATEVRALDRESNL